MKVPELGKHGIGIDIRKGDEFVVPAGFIQISANPLKSSSHLYRPGLAWFIELVFGTDITGNRDNFPPYLDKQIESFDRFLRDSNLFDGVNFDDSAQEQRVYDTAVANKGTAEWFAFVAANLAMFAKDAIGKNDADSAAWAAAVSERFRSLWIFKQNFEEAVWMGQSAKRLIDALSLWKANEGNGDEGFWQTSLRESSYIFSQLFSVPVTFIQGRAYVGGQQIDGRNARLVDFLLSGGSSGEAILIEIKTPTTPLIQKSKYRTSIHAPSSDLSGAIVQAADYRNCVLREIRGVTQDRPSDLSTFNPKAIVIVGNYTSELDSDEKRRSFELYRTSLSNIEIITFDELFGKIEHLAKLFNLVKTNESGASPQGAKEH